MDPLSLTASIIAIIGVGSQVAKTIKTLTALKDASDLNLALNNEIVDLGLITLAIQDTFQKQRIAISPEDRAEDANAYTSIINSLLQAKTKAIELELLHKRLTTTASGSHGSTCVQKFRWLREQERVRRMQEDLRNVRLKLAAALGVLNS